MDLSADLTPAEKINWRWRCLDRLGTYGTVDDAEKFYQWLIGNYEKPLARVFIPQDMVVVE